MSTSVDLQKPLTDPVKFRYVPGLYYMHIYVNPDLFHLAGRHPTLVDQSTTAVDLAVQ